MSKNGYKFLSPMIVLLIIVILTWFPSVTLAFPKDMEQIESHHEFYLNELSEFEVNNFIKEDLVEIDAERKEALSKDPINSVYITSTPYLNFYEIEPNNYIHEANLVSNSYYGQNFYRIYGTITNYSYDLDYFRFDVTKSGTFDILGIWLDDYYGLGWEDDLGIGLCDSNGNIIAAAMLKGSGSDSYRHLVAQVDPGTYYIVVLQMSDYEYLYVGEWYGLDLQFHANPSVVSTPTTPSGPSEGFTNEIYNYSTGDAVCSNGHSVEYRYDWGDGSYSNWSSSTIATKSWSTQGTYQIKAQARCAYDNNIISSWSAAKETAITVDILPGSDANLSTLVVDPGILTPPFDAVTTNYTLAVDHFVESIDVTATLSDENATMTINDDPADSGETETVSLGDPGTATVINIVVTAEDGLTENTYTVTVNRLDSDQTFTDVTTDHPFFEEIEKLVALGITTGYEDGTFRPSNPVTRMAMAAFLYRGLELADAAVKEPTFSDVPTDHPFFTEIEALAASGITTGYDDGTFRPSANVTRMAVAAFLVRGLQLDLKYVVPAEPTFNDVTTTHPFYDEIELLAASGITTGYTDGTFRPSANVTRMAMAAFLVRGLELE